MRYFMKEWVEPVIIAVVLALIIRTFVVQAFKIPTGSMRPTLMEGDRILVNKFIYKFKKPERGDVMVF
ncbi:MAG: signal peptidase I [Proteobacteria bacterium]|nr:signal peptidase I [Pseudomonadota bacterium]